MENKKFKKICIISCGKCNKRYCYLVSGVLITNLIFLFLIIFFILYSIKNELDTLNFSNFLSLSFFINIGESLMIIPYFILKKEIRTKDDIKKIQDNGIVPFKYIFNNYSEEFSKKDKLYFILFGILKLILDISYILYQHLVEEDYSIFKSFTYSFQFELIFLFLLSKLIYKKQFYKHQYISIIILAILGLSRVIVEYIVNETDNFFINLIIQIVYSFFKALMIVYVK